MSTLYTKEEIESYKASFNKLQFDGTILKDWDTFSNWLYSNTQLSPELTSRAFKHINGSSNFLTLNRFIKTMHLISSLETEKKCIIDLIPEFAADFYFLEYTLIPDSQEMQLSLPLKMYEIKVDKDTDINDLKGSIKDKHGLKQHKDYSMFICDLWKKKIHKEFRGIDHEEINRESDDIFVYFKVRPKHLKSKQCQAYVVNIKYENEPNSVCLPLLVLFDGQSRIKQMDVYRNICKVISPFLINDELRNSIEFKLKVIPNKINEIAFGYIRLKCGELDLIMPQELILMVMNFTIFDIENCPFLINASCKEDTLEIKDVEGEIDLPEMTKKNLKFEIIFMKKDALKTGYYARKNRMPVELDKDIDGLLER